MKLCLCLSVSSLNFWKTLQSPTTNLRKTLLQSHTNLIMFMIFLVISAPSILDEHCIIENNDGFVLLEPFPDATCCVNGTAVRKRQRLQQGRLWFWFQNQSWSMWLFHIFVYFIRLSYLWDIICIRWFRLYVKILYFVYWLFLGPLILSFYQNIWIIFMINIQRI